MRQIKDMKELKKLAAKEGGIDCFILLNSCCKSSKHIKYYEGDKHPFFIINFIDNTEQELTEGELYTKSNIGEALKKNALILED